MTGSGLTGYTSNIRRSPHCGIGREGAEYSTTNMKEERFFVLN